MLLRPERRAGFDRPKGQFSLNLDSPQARGLLGWWAGNGHEMSIDRVAGVQLAQSAAGITYNAAPLGIAMAADVSGAGIYGLVPPSMQIVGGPGYSIVLWGMASTDVTADGSAFLFGTAYANNPSTSPYTANLLIYWNGTGFPLSYAANNGGVFQGGGFATTIVAGVPFCAVVTHDGVHTTSYLQGISEAQAATSLAPSYDPTASIGFGDINGTNRRAGCRFWDGRFYNYPLTPDEVWALFDPATRWDLYAVPSSRTFFDMGTAVPDKVPYQPNYQWAPILAQ